MSRAAGVDVGVRKGCDVVILEDRAVVAHHAAVQPGALADVVERHDADVVAIDSPPSYAQPGTTRAAERELLRRGIRLFVTPDEERGAIAWYDWMRAGFACFGAVAPRYPRYRGGALRHTTFEVFPHATALVLHGGPAPRDVSKATHRRAVLEQAGIDTTDLRTIDALDAGLCALTGLLALEGATSAVGDPDEGLILVPVPVGAGRRVRTP